MQPHAIHKLHQYRQSIATKPYASRGKSRVRCQWCLLAQPNCTCDARKQLSSNAAFLLVMYDDEVLKPSNSGRLIADLIPDTHGFIWSRTEPAEQMLTLIHDECYQPMVVFPAEYAMTGQTVLSEVSEIADDKMPLFIVLDGSWREAKKMFRKSPYLHHLPLLSFNPERVAQYALRKNSRDFQLGTAEVASLVLESLGEEKNAQSMNAWFELFVVASKYGRNSVRTDTLPPIGELKQAFLASLK